MSRPNEQTPLIQRHPSATMDSSSSRRQTISTAVILVVLILERLAFYALATTFYLFLNEGPWHEKNGWDSLDAMNAVFVLTGLSYFSAFFGGYISDAWLGRFKTIVVGFVLYIIGYIFLTLMSIDLLPRSSTELQATNDLHNINDNLILAPCKTMVYISITILGTGVGIVKTNIAAFGAEQMRTSNPQKMRWFFNWFYWCVNIGSLIGVGVVSFIEQDSPGVCTNGFFCGYVIATTSLTLALLLLIAVMPCHHIVPIEGSLIGNILRILKEAFTSQIRHWRYNRQNPNINPFHLEPSFLDRAKVRYGGSFHEEAVDDVRSLGKLLAVFTALIPYWLVYFQMETSFQAQGFHMKFESASVNKSVNVTLKDFGYEANNWKFSIPAAWLSLFDQFFLIIAIPILTSFLYPVLDKAGIRLSLLFRIGVGMLFSAVAVMTAGGLESYRLYLWRTDNSSHIHQDIGNVTYDGVDISIFWQVPQYVLVGAAEAFASIAGLEYAYSAAPTTFRGMIMGLFYSMEGIGSFLGVALLQMVAPFWFNNMTNYGDINNNHLDFYLYFLGCIQWITFFAYCGILYAQRFSLRIVQMPARQGGGLLRTGRTEEEMEYPARQVEEADRNAPYEVDYLQGPLAVTDDRHALI